MSENRLKNDDVCTSGLANHRERRIFAKGMLDEARRLGGLTLAEHVESEAAFRSIRKLGRIRPRVIVWQAQTSLVPGLKHQ